METLKVGELKSKFFHILQRVQAGEEIIIGFGKREKKIAVLVPYDKYISENRFFAKPDIEKIRKKSRKTTIIYNPHRY